MSTEPGWMPAADGRPLLLGASRRRRHKRSSMLLSFERPASAGPRAERNKRAFARSGAPAGDRLSAVLENCTEATSAAIDKRRLKTGITWPAPASSRTGLITVKIVRAHGGCLGTKSR